MHEINFQYFKKSADFVKDIIITDLITVDAEKASQQNNN